MILSLESDFRSDLSQLRETHPDLHQELEDLRHTLNPNAESSEILQKNEPSPTSVQRRTEAAEKFGEMLAKIRSLPGFQRFQLPPMAVELKQNAATGPIVVFNATRIRTDAIIVTVDGIESIPVSGLSIEQLCKWQKFMTPVITKAHFTIQNSTKKDTEASETVS